MSGSVPWPRIVAEGLVIVVSVLLALAADAWWDGRQDRVEEALRLAAVQAELEVARESYRGLLETISGRKVRQSLAQYDATVERLRGEAVVIRERFERELPFVYEFVNLRRQMATSPSAAFDVGLPDVPLRPRYGELLSNRRFLNQMVGHAALLARLRLRTEEALSGLEELASVLAEHGYGSPG